jgi:MFS family permease
MKEDSPEGYGYYGWVIVGVSFLNLLVSFGIWYSYSVFLVALTSEFGWDRTTTSSIFSVFVMVIGLSGPFVGHAVDRLGTKKVLTSGALMVALGLYLCGRVESILLFYLTFGGIAGLGESAVGLVGNSRAISRWFVFRRGIAAGIATSGIGLGLLIFVPMIQAWVTRHGSRSGFFFLAALSAFLLVPLNGLLQREGPRSSGSFPASMGRIPCRENSLLSLVRTTQFWYLFWIFFAGGFIVQAVLIHQIAIAVESGIEKFDAATAFGITGLLGTLTRMVWGGLSDRIGREKTYFVAYLAITLGLGSLLAARMFQSLTALYGYSIFFGMGYGAVASLNMAIAADRFSGTRFGLIYGILFIGTSLGGAAGPLVLGIIFDQFSNYTPAIATLPAVILLSYVALYKVYMNRIPPAVRRP